MMTEKVAICLRNNPDLQKGRVYRVISATPTESYFGMIRVIDDSQEDYLYPQDWFSVVDLELEEYDAIFDI